MKYRKKPVTVDAWDVGDLMEAFRHSQLPEMVLEVFEEGLIDFETDHIKILSLEGVVVGRRGDMLVRGVKGEFYPCRRDIFEETYERETT